MPIGLFEGCNGFEPLHNKIRGRNCEIKSQFLPFFDKYYCKLSVSKYSFRKNLFQFFIEIRSNISASAVSKRSTFFAICDEYFSWSPSFFFLSFNLSMRLDIAVIWLSNFTKKLAIRVLLPMMLFLTLTLYQNIMSH